MDYPFAGAGDYWRWVDMCEQGGVDSIWQTDRLVTRQPILECMTALAAIAGRTRRGKFGVNVVSVAMRDPVLLAKQCATIDVLSEGRLLPAFGIGSPLGPEWQALDIDTKTRGRRTDESLEIIARLWREDSVDFAGRHYKLKAASISPKPVQADLPMWIGGSSDAAVKRMGRAWKRLHLLAYPIGVLALWHYFLQSKANVSEAVFAAGIFAWLMLWRAIPERARRHRAAQWAVLPLLAVAAPLATAGIEFAWYALATNINPWRVLAANQSIEFELRPAHWIFACAAAAAAIAAARRLLPTPRRVSAPRSSDPIRARTANGS